MQLYGKHRKIIDALWHSSDGVMAAIVANDVGKQNRNLREPLEQLFGSGYVQFRSGPEHPWRSHNDVAELPNDPRNLLYYRLTPAARLAVRG